MKRVQGGFRAECDLIIDLFKPQPLDGVFFAHDSLHDVRNCFTNVIICNFALDNIIAVKIICSAAAGNDQLQPFHARAVELQKLKMFCGWYYSHYALANGIWYALIVLGLILCIVSLVRKIRSVI